MSNRLALQTSPYLQQHADNPWVRGHRSVINAAYDVIRQHVGQLDVRCNIDGAHISINGTDAGTSPLTEPVHTEAGSAALVVVADGYDTVRRDVSVLAGQLNREEVELQRTASSPGFGTASPAPSHPSLVPGIVVAGTGVAAIVVGLVLVATNLLSSPPAGCAGTVSPWMCTDPGAYSQVINAATAVYAGDVLLAGGGAAIVAGGVLFGIAAAGQPHERGTAWQVVPGVGSVTLVGRF